MEGERGGRVSQFIRVSDHQQGEHGLSDVESVSPVVVGDPPVAFTEGVYEPHQGLQNTHSFLLLTWVYMTAKKNTANNHQSKVRLNTTLLFNFSIPSLQLKTQVAAPSQISASANDCRHTDTWWFRSREQRTSSYTSVHNFPTTASSEMPVMFTSLTVSSKSTVLWHFLSKHRFNALQNRISTSSTSQLFEKQSAEINLAKMRKIWTSRRSTN